MNRDEILRLFEAHREAEAARDIDAILETFAPNCFLETIPSLGFCSHRLQPRGSIEAPSSWLT